MGIDTANKGVKEELYEMERVVHRRKSKYVATCPLCGKPLFRSYSGEVEIRCGKCKNMIVIMIQDGIVTCFQSRRSVERSELETAVNL